MKDLLSKAGLNVMVQVNFGRRWGRRRFLGKAGRVYYAMLRALDLGLGWGSPDRPPPEEAHPWAGGVPTIVDSYSRPVAPSEGVRLRKDTAEVVERTLISRVLQEPSRATHTLTAG